MAIGDYTNVLQQFYIAYFGRPADPIGLNSAAQALSAAGAPTTTQGLVNAYSTNATVRTLIDNFGNSAESQALYGSVTTPDTIANFVTQIYLNVLNRAPDTEGFNYWVNEIASGRLIPSRVALTILDAATRTADAATVNNKLAVANNFTTAINTPAEITAYSGNEAAAAARAMLSNVDAATNVAAFGVAINDTIGNLLDSASGPGSVTLTTGVDVASARVFNSTTVLVDGSGFINTLDDRDELTGLGDNAVLNATIGGNTDINDVGGTFVIQPTLTGISTVNVGFINTGENTQFNLTDATGLAALNVTRVSADRSVELSDLAASVTNISVNDAARGASVEFNYREDVLVGTESLNLGLNNVRLSSLALQEGGDGGADQGQFFETVSITVNDPDGNNGADIDNFTIQANEPGKVQTVNLTANERTEINQFGVTGAEFINISANAAVIIDKSVNGVRTLEDSSISSPELDVLTITGAGNVTIDGLDGIDDADDAPADNADQLIVSAGGMTGDLSLGITIGADSDISGEDYKYRADVDLMVTSGSGDDLIVVHSSLAGSIITNGGNDEVVLQGAEGNDTVPEDMEGVSLIDTGAGNDTVSVNNLLVTASDFDQEENDGYDDVTAAAIVTGADNDTVTANVLRSGEDWDNFVLDDANADDLYVIKGASISTGAGNDIINVASLEENATIDAGANNDMLNVVLVGGDSEGPSFSSTVLAGDTDPDITKLGNKGGQTQEVTTAGVADRLGAVVDMGEGSDIANFIETDGRYSGFGSGSTGATLIVGHDAELRSAETVNVVALDFVAVTTTTTNTDSNANVLGTVTLNLTVANQIDQATKNVVANVKQNDDSENDGEIYADVLRFDDALETINLVSQERTQLQNAASEIYRPGTETFFELDNIRQDIALTLKANEATGVSGGKLKDDNHYTVDATTGNSVLNFGAYDVELDLNYADARNLDDSAELNITADSGAIDLDIFIERTETDLGSNEASTSDDDSNQIENFTINFADANSHSVDMNGFGDADFRGEDSDFAPAAAGDVSSTAETSFTVNSAAGAGKTITVYNVTADTITFNNADGTGETTANVVVQVGASNNYAIFTGSGNDLIDMRADDVRSDDGATPVDRADVIDASTGRDTLYVDGLDSLGNNNFADTDLGTGPTDTNFASTVVDDDVFATVRGVERILIDTQDTTESGEDAGGNEITLDEQAVLAGIDSIVIVGDDGNSDSQDDDDYVLNLLIGNNYFVPTGPDNNNGQLTTAASALVIDASGHQDGTFINLESKDDDSDVQVVNLDIRISSDSDGAVLNLLDTGDEDAQVDVRVTAETGEDELTFIRADLDADDEADMLTDVFSETALNFEPELDRFGVTDGDVIINVQNGSFDRLILAEGDYGNLVIDIAKDWGRKVEGTTRFTFEVDASALTGGTGNDINEIMVDEGNQANLIIKGTQDDDLIEAGLFNDTIMGNGGDDEIFGGNGADSIDGGNGNDFIAGYSTDPITPDDGANDTLAGGAGVDTIDGGLGGDLLTGGAGVDTFTYYDQAESNGDVDTTDTITDFESGTDVIHLVMDAGGFIPAVSSPMTPAMSPERTVDLSSFTVVNTGSQGENSLRGADGESPETNAQFDGYYSAADGQLAIDVDGDGEIRSDVDFVINSASVITQADIQTVLFGVGQQTTVFIGNNTSTLSLSSLDVLVLEEDTDPMLGNAAIDFTGINQDSEHFVVGGEDEYLFIGTLDTLIGRVEDAFEEQSAAMPTVGVPTLGVQPGPGTLFTEKIYTVTFASGSSLSGFAAAEFQNSLGGVSLTEDVTFIFNDIDGNNSVDQVLMVVGVYDANAVKDALYSATDDGIPANASITLTGVQLDNFAIPMIA